VWGNRGGDILRGETFKKATTILRKGGRNIVGRGDEGISGETIRL